MWTHPCPVGSAFLQIYSENFETWKSRKPWKWTISTWPSILYSKIAIRSISYQMVNVFVAAVTYIKQTVIFALLSGRLGWYCDPSRRRTTIEFTQLTISLWRRKTFLRTKGNFLCWIIWTIFNLLLKFQVDYKCSQRVKM